MGGNRVEESMKRLTLILVAVLGLLLVAPAIAGTFDGSYQVDGRHQFSPSASGGK
jgi:hypothetical protein